MQLLTTLRRLERAAAERDVLGSVKRMLKARGILFFRMNTGAAKYGRRWVSFGFRGMADLLAFVPVRVNGSRFFRVLWIETKAARRGAQSKHQKLFQMIVESEKQEYILARSAHDVSVLLDKC